MLRYKDWTSRNGLVGGSRLLLLYLECPGTVYSQQLLEWASWESEASCMWLDLLYDLAFPDAKSDTPLRFLLGPLERCFLRLNLSRMAVMVVMSQISQRFVAAPLVAHYGRVTLCAENATV